jgi:hypothetical protein
LTKMWWELRRWGNGEWEWRRHFSQGLEKRAKERAEMRGNIIFG